MTNNKHVKQQHLNNMKS